MVSPSKSGERCADDAAVVCSRTFDCARSSALVTCMAVSPDDVRGAYRFILGRAPENEAVVELHRQRAPSFEALRLAFFNSEEFRSQTFPVPSQGTVSLGAPPQAIETATDPATLRAIIAKTAAYWQGIGETAPHWSVLTYDQYKPDRFVKNETSFFESGKHDLDLLLALLSRIGQPAKRFRRCLEFGCGVGRVTVQLAATFPEVVALDISRSHLQLAQEYLARHGHTNVSFLQGTAEDLHPGTGYDLWYSRLVLQHNPPPVTLCILDKMFAGLAPRGVAVVHVPTYCVGYSFNIADYLAGKLGSEMEMHFTPQKPILELAWRHGCCLVDIREEPVGEKWVVNHFVFQKTDDHNRRRFERFSGERDMTNEEWLRKRHFRPGRFASNIRRMIRHKFAGLLNPHNGQSFETKPYNRAVPLVFMHVPKTSGVAFTQNLIEAIAPRRVLYAHDRVLSGAFDAFDKIDPDKIRDIYFDPMDLPSDADFVCGHLSFSTPQQKYRTAQFITLLREPVSRILSNWLYWRSHSDDELQAWGAWGKEMAKAREPLVDFLSNQDCAANTDNVHVRMLLWPHRLIPSGDFIDERNDEALTSEAINRLKQFDYVDVLENPRLEANLQVWLGRRFKHASRNEARTVPGPLRTPLHSELTKDVFDLLEIRSRLDLKLWTMLARERVSHLEPEILRERTLMRTVARYSWLMLA